MNNIFYKKNKVSCSEREKLIKQKGMVIWLFGLSGAGKTTLAFELERQLFKKNKLCYCLDGDNIRTGLNKDLSFTDSDRYENIRRIAEVSALFCDAGIITIASFITPKEKYREMIKDIVPQDKLKLIYIKSSIEICIKRDPKKLYKKALNKKIKNFTGITSAFEEPENYDLLVDTENYNIEECIKKITKYIDSLNKKVSVS